MIEFSAEQLAVLTALTVMIPWLVVVAIWIVSSIARRAWKPPAPYLKAFVFVVSAVLAYCWAPRVGLPDPAADPAGFAMSLLVLATSVFKFANAVYDYLLTPIMRAIDDAIAKLLGKEWLIVLRP